MTRRCRNGAVAQFFTIEKGRGSGFRLPCPKLRVLRPAKPVQISDFDFPFGRPIVCVPQSSPGRRRSLLAGRVPTRSQFNPEPPASPTPPPAPPHKARQSFSFSHGGVGIGEFQTPAHSRHGSICTRPDSSRTDLGFDFHSPDHGSRTLKIDSHGTLDSLTRVLIERGRGFD